MTWVYKGWVSYADRDARGFALKKPITKADMETLEDLIIEAMAKGRRAKP